MPLTYMYRKRADIYTTQGGDKMQGLFITLTHVINVMHKIKRMVRTVTKLYIKIK